jgi:biotin carboxyl carrier protein
MKFDINLQVGSVFREHQIDLITDVGDQPTEGHLQFFLDNAQGEADWVEIAPGVYSILVGGRSHEVHIAAISSERGAPAGSYDATLGKRRYRLEVRDPRRRRHFGTEEMHEGPREIVAPMPGKIIRILVSENQEVVQGEGLVVIEAMKMQNELCAPRSGRVEKIYVNEGAGVEMGFKLLRLA